MNCCRVIGVLILFGYIMEGDANPGLSRFVSSILREGFETWVLENYYDTFQPFESTLPIQLDQSLYTLQGELSNITFHGLSTAYGFTGWDCTGFETLKICGYYYVPGNITGVFDLNGTILDMHSFGGVDKFSITSIWPNGELFVAYYHDFHICNGFVCLNNTRNPDNRFSFDNIAVEFPNLFTPEAEPFKETIVNDIMTVFRQSVQLQFYNFTFNFLYDKFLATPISDIINWPEPTEPPQPTSTISTTTSTPTITSEPTTTSHPCLASQGTNPDARSQGFNNFLNAKLRRFGGWVVDNGLDPTPPSVGNANLEVNSSFLQLNANYSLVTGEGLSDSQFISAESNLLASSFNFVIQMPNVNLYGAHASEGMIASLYPLRGSGLWFINNVNMQLNLTVYNFGIVNGYVDIDRAGNQYESIYVFDSNHVEFPGFLRPEDADGLGAAVLEELGPRMMSELLYNGKHPVREMMYTYLRTIFAENTLAEIIATTPMPC